MEGERILFFEHDHARSGIAFEELSSGSEAKDPAADDREVVRRQSEACFPAVEALGEPLGSGALHAADPGHRPE
jgi:hypothetical protein